jgi:hypothetical protein
MRPPTREVMFALTFARERQVLPGDSRAMSRISPEPSNAMTAGMPVVSGKPERRPHGLARCS